MKKYSEFYLNMLFESIFQVDSNFMEVLDKISDDPIASKLINLINKDITIQYNFIQRGDTEDQVYFLPDSQGQKAQDPWSKKNNSAKIGRIVNQILTSQGVTFVPAEIEKFVNRYKTAWKEINSPKDPIQLVSGDQIKYWYNQKNYYDDKEGVLGNSCMRYPRCQSYFRIYTDNPGVCQLAILLDEDDLLIGRCLVWKMSNDNTYIDRIYTRWDDDVELMYNNLKKKFPNSLSHYDEDYDDPANKGTLSITLESSFIDEFKKLEDDVSIQFPYMDSLYFFYPLSGKLTNENDESQFCLKLQDTSGGFGNYSNIVWSNYSQEFVDKSEYIKTNGDWLPKSEVEQDYQGYYYKKGELTHSDLYSGLVYNPVQTEWGIAPQGDIIEVEGLEVPGIFQDKVELDIQKFPVFTYIGGYFYLVRNLEKSIEKGNYLKNGVQMVSIPTTGLVGKICQRMRQLNIIYYKDNYPIGISNLVGKFNDNDINHKYCYTIQNWLDLLPENLVKDLKIQASDLYISELDRFYNILSYSIESSGSWETLILLDNNVNAKKVFGNIVLRTREDLNKDVIEYVTDFFQRVREFTIPLLESDTSVRYNIYLKEEFTKKDLLKDSDFLDYLFTYINRWWIDLGTRYLRLDDKFNQYFVDQSDKEELISSIVEKIIYDIVYHNKSFSSYIIRSLNEDSVYYRNQLERLKTFSV